MATEAPIDRFARLRRLRVTHTAFTPVVAALSLLASAAQAVTSADPADGNMMNFVGDGALPSLLQGVSQSAGTGGGIPSAVGVGERGDASYSYGLKLPPARLAPSLGLSYASSAVSGRELPQGWSLSGVAEIAPARGPAFAGLGYFTLSGPVGDGLLVPGGTSGTYVLKGGTAPVSATFDAATRLWTLRSAGIEMTLSPALGSSYDFWRVTRTADPWGNEAIHSYTAEGRLSTLTYGGNGPSSTPPVVRVSFS